jgi:hypothetical protein
MTGREKRARKLRTLLVDPRLRILSVECRHRAAERRRNKEIDEFWARVDKSGECWIWTGAKRPAGYGIYYHGGESLAHRYAYLITYGSPKGSVVRHTCDNRPCVRPDHLILGTHADNVADTISRGRFRSGRGCQVGERNNGATISELQAQAVLDLWASGRYRQGEIAEITGVTLGNVGNIACRISWTHLEANTERFAGEAR